MEGVAGEEFVTGLAVFVQHRRGDVDEVDAAFLGGILLQQLVGHGFLAPGILLQGRIFNGEQIELRFRENFLQFAAEDAVQVYAGESITPELLRDGKYADGTERL